MSNDNDIATPSADRLAWRVAEVAQLTGLGETTLWAEIRAGRLPVARISARCTVVRAADLEAYLERAARPPEVPAGPAPRGRRGRRWGPPS